MTRQEPFFSIIVPTYARPKHIAALLDATARLDYPRDRFEVIVVDDGSPTSPEATVAAFRDRINVTLVVQPHSGPAAARNRGAAQAKCDFLAFTDDDCAPAPDWLRALALRFADSPDCAIGGLTINKLTDNFYSTASQMLIDYLYGYFNAKNKHASFFAANNLAIPCAHFHSLGGFDATFPSAAAEDRDLCARWRDYGFPMIYAPEVTVYHSHSLTLGAFWRQHFNYGCGASHFHQLRMQRRQERLMVEPPSFYLNLLRYPFSRFQASYAVRLAVLLVLSQTANAVGFLYDWTKHLRAR